MNQVTRMKHSRAYHTTVHWILTEWTSVVDMINNRFKSQQFVLNHSGIICLFELQFADTGAGVLLMTIGPRPYHINITLSIHILDCNMKKEVLVSEESVNLTCGEDLTFLRFDTDDDLEMMSYSDNDYLTICCEVYEDCSDDDDEDEGYVRGHCMEGGGEARLLDDVSIDNGDDNTDDEKGSKPYKIKFEMWNYDRLYRAQDICDLMIVVAGKAVMCHSFVLAHISPYLAGLIRHTRPGYFLQRQIDISNETWLSHPLFQAFLEYAYGAQSVFELRDLVFELLLLSCKFTVRRLKIDCEHYLLDNMDKFNVVRILCVAHQYGCKVLKEKAIDYAKNCLDDLRFFGELDTLRRDPKLYYEVVGDDELNSMII